MKHYHLYCLQNNGLMATGLNSRTKEEVKDSLISYLSADHNDDNLKTLETINPDELAEMYEFEIQSTDKKIKEWF